LPPPGSGTLDDMEISLPDGFSLRMKSGSFTRVRCYSGYVLAKNGTPEYAFSLMVNDFDCTHSEMKREIGAFLKMFFSRVLAN
jgi:D-alanyl-D-alanine carboxypeptidase/D-alanyl-D-alanine-endopeptidase (penicillin-binding protein 4)